MSIADKTRFFWNTLEETVNDWIYVINTTNLKELLDKYHNKTIPIE